MAWCNTHNRIITRTYTSCSVAAEQRGDCIPIFWRKLAFLKRDEAETDQIAEHHPDWQEIVDRAYREGKIGLKGIKPEYLHALLFSPYYNPSVATDTYAPLLGGWR